MNSNVGAVDDSSRSWVYRLPGLFACFLLAICLITSQWNPCDATSVSMGSSLTFILLAMGIGVLVAMDSVLTKSHQEPGRQFHWLVVTLVLFGLWLWVCTTRVPGRGNARFAINGCWQWIAQWILTLSIAKLCWRYAMGPALSLLMLGSVAGTIAMASHQYFFSMPALRKMFASDPDAFFEKMGSVAGSSDAMQLANRLGSLEPTGPFALTNSLAGLMATWLVFAAVKLVGSARLADPLRARRGNDSGWGSHLLSGGLLVAMFVTLLLTKSRSAWLAALVCLAAASLLHPAIRSGGWAIVSRFRKMFIAVAIGVVCALGWVVVRDPMILAEAGKSVAYRFDYWRGAVTLIQAEPWMGYGVANFQQNYNRIKSVTASESPADPHNFVLETAVAGGWPLLLLLTAILAIFFLKTLEVAKGSSVPEGLQGSGFENHRNVHWSILGGALASGMAILFFETLVSDPDTIVSSVLYVGVSMVVGLLLIRCDGLANDRYVSATCLISAGVLLVHLVASGGWMQPGVMNSLCVLVGIAFGSTSGESKSGEPSNAAVPRFGSARHFKTVSIVYLLFVSVAAVGFLRTMGIPLLAASGAKSLIANGANAVQDPNDWLAILELDAMDPDLPSMAANRLMELLGNRNLSEAARQKYTSVFDACCEAYLKRDPNQWVPYAECGRWNAVLGENEESLLAGGAEESRKERAYRYFAKSAALYPNSVQTQLQAAVVAVWCGKTEEAIRHANKAEEIDRETPHADRKLAAAVVFFPKKLELSMGPLGEQAKVGEPGYAKGEPTLQWLRNTVR